jgi:hypothetical protein
MRRLDHVLIDRKALTAISWMGCDISTTTNVCRKMENNFSILNGCERVFILLKINMNKGMPTICG